MPLENHPRGLTSRFVGARRAVAATALLAGLFVLGTYAVPLLESAGHQRATELRALWAPLCHQIAERSIDIGGRPQTVCARCAGLYLGGFVGLLAAWLVVIGRLAGPRPRWLLWTVLPTAIDALLPWVGLPGLPALPRLLLALAPGLIAGIFLAIGVHDLFLNRGKADSRRADSGIPPVLEGCDG